MLLSHFCQRKLASTRAFFKVAGFLLLCLTYSTIAFGQNNFIAQVEGQKLNAFKQYVSSENGDISQVIHLEASHLVGFHGDQGLKAKVRRFDGVLLVSDNPEVQWIDPAQTILLGIPESDLGRTEGTDEGTKDLAELQWGMDAIQVKEAWTQSRGKGVRVAIIDNGIDADHQDLKANLNTALSKSFVPTEGWEARQEFGFNHGTHIAGIIAANDNQEGTHGIAPEAELIALKVASEKTGSGDFSWLLEAIVYAADQHVDIANVGLGQLYPKEGAQGIRAEEMKQMIEVAAAYANKKGVTLIAPAGDDNKNIDDCCLYLPAHAEPFLTVSATAPVGWAFDPDVNPEKPTSYSNFGVSTVDFAAPGGDILYPGRDYCVKAEMNRPCWAFDLVFSTISNGWGWAAGSSMSAAFLTGVAALIHSKEEQEMSPELMKLLLIGHARQRGKSPGNDAFYGFGITNAFAENHEIAHEHTTIEIIDGMLSNAKSEHVSPRSFELYQNYPNPFNPQTTINFHIPKAARVQVSVFDLMGSQVATLVDQELDTGCYNTSWNGRGTDGRALTSGVYMYKIDAESFVDAKVMTFANN
ncbi:MAG: S8 family serine peptidase [Rhodothermales bacterium]